MVFRSGRNENLRVSSAISFLTLTSRMLLAIYLLRRFRHHDQPRQFFYAAYYFFVLFCALVLFYYVARGSDRTVKIWDMAAKECVHTFDSAHNNQVPFLLLIIPAVRPRLRPWL